MSALKNFAMVGFVAVSIAGSVVSWKERSDLANLSPFFKIESSTVQLEHQVAELRRERDGLAAQVESSRRSRTPALISRTESR